MEERTLQMMQPHHQVQGPGATVTEKAPDDDGTGESESEFEFPSVSRDSPAGTAAPADELFADGRIRPFYFPAESAVFDRGVVPHFGGGAAAQQPAAPARVIRGQLGRLFLEESRARDSSSSVSSESSDDDGGGGLEGASPESYCLWTPAGSSSSSPRAPPARKRSSSTGSSVARWRRISELVVGRSSSDGKDRFMLFFPAPPQKGEAADSKRHNNNNNKMPPSKQAITAKVHQRPIDNNNTARSGGWKKQQAPFPSPSPATEAEVDSAHRVAYGATPRRTFLPYREELVGFFANVNGVSRSHHHHLTF